jgi:hypothetical protein
MASREAISRAITTPAGQQAAVCDCLGAPLGIGVIEFYTAAVDAVNTHS